MEMTQEEFDEIDQLQMLLRDSADIAFPHFERKGLIQMMYDGDINPGEYGTSSELYFPVLRTAVKKALPDAIGYAFPPDGFVSLQPTKPGVTFDTVKQFEGALDNVLNNQMQVKMKSIPIFQDAIKFGSGYGLVETESVTVAESGVFTILEDGESKGKRRDLKISSTQKLMPKLTHIPYECVIPSPDASTVDDGNCIMVIHYYRSDEFQDLYKSQEASELKIYKGDPDDIIKDAREKQIDGVYPHWWNVQSMAGGVTDPHQRKYQKMNDIARRIYSERDENSITIIPVVKYFFNKKQVWLANGDTMIFKDQDSYQTMRKPIIKASLDFDSGNWWALSDIAASRDMAYGINAFNNAMLDMMGQYLRPMMAYDQSRYGGKDAPRYEPYGTIAVNGNIQGAIQTIAPAQLPGGMTQFGQLMNQEYNDANMEPLGGESSPGLVRGGSFAFESLLQTQNAPREFAGMLLDMGFLEPLIYHTMVLMQSLPVEEFEYMELEEKSYVARRIDLNDIRFGFEVNMDTSAKLRKSINDQMANVTMYQNIYKDNPWIKQQEALALVIGNKEHVKLLLKTDKEYQETIKQIQENAAKQPENANSPMTQGQPSER